MPPRNNFVLGHTRHTSINHSYSITSHKRASQIDTKAYIELRERSLRARPTFNAYHSGREDNNRLGSDIDMKRSLYSGPSGNQLMT